MRKRLIEIDYLRAYAVLMVAALHFILIAAPRSPEIRGFLAKTGLDAGVDLFFVISGYVISDALRELWAVTNGQEAVKKKSAVLLFYCKRFVRLWPAAACWLVINVFLAIVFSHLGFTFLPSVADTFRKAIAGLVYLYNFEEYLHPSALGYFWSLSVEWQFYVCFPILLLLARTDARRLAILGAALVISMYIAPGGQGWWMFRFDGLALGVLVYVVHRRLGVPVPKISLYSNKWFRGTGTLILLAAVILSPRFTSSREVGFLLSSILACILVWFAAADRGYVSCFGCRSVVAWLGSRSYSVYLCQVPAGFIAYALVTRLNGTSLVTLGAYWAYYLLSVGLTALVGELTYRFVEKPSHAASRGLTLDSVGLVEVASVTPSAAPTGHSPSRLHV